MGNLSIHKTDATIHIWKDELPNFNKPIFVPEGITLSAQAIEYCLSIDNKIPVYNPFHDEHG